MSQRVPNCDVDESNIPAATKNPLLPNFGFISHEVPMLGYKHKVAEPACKKVQQQQQQQPWTHEGNTTWDNYKPRGSGGTLESIVNQHVSKSYHNNLMVMDALVPCFSKQGTRKVQNSGLRLGGCSSPRVRSGDSVEVKDELRKRAGLAARGTGTHDVTACKKWSLSGGETCGRDSSVAFNSASMGSPENTTSSGKQYTRTTANDDHDSVSHRMSQSEARDEDCKATRSSESNKRNKASVVHNQSERRRRDKINQRMKELQMLVPNSSKTDKASMLDEVIQYMKQLQAQVQMMNWMKMYSSMMLPITMQQQLKMSMMMAQMGIGMGMNKDMVMNMNNIMNIPHIPRMLHVPPFMPMASCPDPLQGASNKSVAMDAYSKMAALYHQLYNSSDSSSKS
ncbi:hypothetical protein VNO78_25512 [Psophocarpus tetragonolobus]|uniref:BHLH domain-containing protein n=1 Tax=Psophocarpus tetragonolobus TaxID=3891 RepID=A0AAN9SA92_PSOTE